jgi:hypothetical protein
MIFQTKEGGEGRLVELCLGYFIAYIFTGLAVKYFTGSAEQGLLGVGQIEYLIYSTIGSSFICLTVVFAFRWYKLKSNQIIKWQGLKFPIEYLYIIPSGICAGIVVPTTTMMYLLPISVMVAMVIMRGSIIVVSRLIDFIQIKQGILTKKVYWEEEVAVVFAILAVSADVLFNKQAGGFDFIHSPAAVIILSSYILSYFIRLYIMNYYKNTRGKGVPQDNKGFFAIEQFATSSTLVIIGVVLFFALRGMTLPPAMQYHEAFTMPSIHWPWEIVAGFAYGVAAFFSVFLFLFKGRTATFAGLVNRLTSLVAGTAATLLFAFFFGGKLPSISEWISLLLIFVAVGFLSKADRRRMVELKKQHVV